MRILHLYLSALGLLIGLAAPAAAIGPDLPLSFRDSFERLELLVDPKAKGDLSVTWQLFGHGEPMRERSLDLQMKSGPTGKPLAEIPLGLDELSGLDPGYYAIKIIVTQSPAKGEQGEPLTIDQWVHVLVSKDGVRRVTQEEYSGATDPIEIGVDATGQKVMLAGGGGKAAEVPLDKTEHHEAPMLGLGGGAAEELPNEGSKPQVADEREEP